MLKIFVMLGEAGPQLGLCSNVKFFEILTIIDCHCQDGLAFRH